MEANKKKSIIPSLNSKYMTLVLFQYSFFKEEIFNTLPFLSKTSQKFLQDNIEFLRKFPKYEIVKFNAQSDYDAMKLAMIRQKPEIFNNIIHSDEAN
jgi:hypothetical protein